MTQDDVIDMARQAGAELYGHPDYATICVNGKDASDFVKAFAKLVAAKERKACAKLCDAEFWRATKRDGSSAGVAAGNCAEAIRARGEA